MRRTPLKRKTPMRRRGKNSYARRPRDIEHMKSVKGLPCVMRGLGAGPCSGPVEADHMGERGLGQKSPDNTCGAMCQGHHRQRTDSRGYFANRSKEWRGTFRRWAIAKTLHMLAEKLTGTAPVSDAVLEAQKAVREQEARDKARLTGPEPTSSEDYLDEKGR